MYTKLLFMFSLLIALQSHHTAAMDKSFSTNWLPSWSLSTYASVAAFALVGCSLKSVATYFYYHQKSEKLHKEAFCLGGLLVDTYKKVTSEQKNKPELMKDNVEFWNSNTIYRSCSDEGLRLISSGADYNYCANSTWAALLLGKRDLSDRRKRLENLYKENPHLWKNESIVKKWQQYEEWPKFNTQSATE